MSRPPTKIIEPIRAGFDAVLGAIADEQKPNVATLSARPFLKWVGGKRSILDELSKRMPENYGAYREGFVGGGALFFNIQPTKAYLSDINFHLMLTYKAVRDDVDRLIKLLELHQKNHGEEYYYERRALTCSETDTTKLAALVIYLNKTCFNGLYRVNRAGAFNVPKGSYKDPIIFEEEVLRNDSKLLQGVELFQHPFHQIPVVREDFYYLDPPYHKTYSQYDGSGFGDDEHKKLAAFCKELDDAKAYFMLSNSDTPFIRSLYARFQIDQVAASRSVSCKGEQRGRENELIIRNY